MKPPSTPVSRTEGETPRSMSLLFVSLVAAAVLASGLVQASVLLARSADAALTCGPSWQSVPLPSGLTYPQALAPITANDIWVVGNSKPSTSADIAAAHWNGSSWALFSPPKPRTGDDEVTSSSAWTNELNGADGVASDDVWAVGTYSADDTTAKTLVEHWNGSTWQVVASPNPGTNTSNVLTSVDALSGTNAWAVGSSLTLPPPGTDAVRKTLIERWNGNSWSVVKSPNPASFGNSLLGVAATGPNDVWAVGWKISDRGLQSLILHYDGKAWTETAAPTVGTGGNVLTDISAVSANDIWAAGYYDDGTEQKTLTLHYNGNSWSSVPSASGGDGVSILMDISASSPSDAWVVGLEYRASLKHYVSTIQHWNGSTWDAVRSAISSKYVYEGAMYSVAKVPGSSQVWAIGYPQDAEVICPSASTAQVNLQSSIFGSKVSTVPSTW